MFGISLEHDAVSSAFIDQCESLYSKKKMLDKFQGKKAISQIMFGISLKHDTVSSAFIDQCESLYSKKEMLDKFQGKKAKQHLTALMNLDKGH